MTLAEAGDALPLGQLAERLACVKSNITQLVDRLEADGLVARQADPRDRRTTLAALTAAGRRACEQGVRLQQEIERELSTRLTRVEAQQLTALLKLFGWFGGGGLEKTGLGMAALVGAVMLVAALSVHVKHGFFSATGGYEYNLVIGVAALSVAFTDPGGLSMDALLGRALSGPLWGIAALTIGLVGGAIQLAQRRPAPAREIATAA
jgi:DNA-binding MarR family transcriptional regulator